MIGLACEHQMSHWRRRLGKSFESAVRVFMNSSTMDGESVLKR